LINKIGITTQILVGVKGNSSPVSVNGIISFILIQLEAQ